MDILSFHVFNGKKWLADSENAWTDDYNESAAFTSAKLAQEIGEREAKGDTIFVMGCMAWIS